VRISAVMAGRRQPFRHVRRLLNVTRLGVTSGLLAAGVPLCLVACASASAPVPSPSGQVATICSTALGSTYVSASLTTVGEVRAFRVGPNLQPAHDAFPGFADSEPAAWCWTGGPSGFTSYGVARGESFKFATFKGTHGTPSGPPAIP
jgi:hypothetical protein